MKPLKLPTSFEQQIAALQDKGFVISDEKKCLALLHQVNYYKLSAYLLPFKTRDGSFEQGIDIQVVENMYRFDQKMRVIIFSAVEQIELFLRTQMAYYQARTYCATAYLNPEIYNNRHDHERFKKEIDEYIRHNRTSLVVKHHVRDYGGIFPIWVIIEYFSIGTLSYFYADMILQDQKNIARDLYNTTPDYLISWLKCLTVLRNKCAHYSRLYYWKFTDYPKIPVESNYAITMRLFDQLMVLKWLYSNHYEWDTKIVTQIEALVEQYADSIELRHIGFPTNWKQKLFYNYTKQITGNIVD